MKIDLKDFRVPAGKGVDLGKWPTIVDPYYKSKKQYEEILVEHMEKLSALQQQIPTSPGFPGQWRCRGCTGGPPCRLAGLAGLSLKGHQVIQVIEAKPAVG